MSPMRFPFVNSVPLTAVLSMALVATSLTALAVRGVASAPGTFGKPNVSRLGIGVGPPRLPRSG